VKVLVAQEGLGPRNREMFHTVYGYGSSQIQEGADILRIMERNAILAPLR
jgi:hypothetical protein